MRKESDRPHPSAAWKWLALTPWTFTFSVFTWICLYVELEETVLLYFMLMEERKKDRQTGSGDSFVFQGVSLLG